MSKRMPAGEEPPRSTANVAVDRLAPAELARAITARLQTLERSDWNKHSWTDRSGREHHGTHFYQARCWFQGGRIGIREVSYQLETRIDVDQARDYLTWLRAGNKGGYYTAHHAGVIRKSKEQLAAQASAEARAVAYKRERSHSRWSSSADVLSAVFIPEKATVVRADEVAEGDRVFWDGKWRTVKRNDEYVPVQPEEAHGLAADIMDAVRRGDYAKAADLGHAMETKANQLADGRDFERTLRFAGNVKPITLLPETDVGVRRAKRVG